MFSYSYTHVIKNSKYRVMLLPEPFLRVYPLQRGEYKILLPDPPNLKLISYKDLPKDIQLSSNSMNLTMHNVTSIDKSIILKN